MVLKQQLQQLKKFICYIFVKIINKCYFYLTVLILPFILAQTARLLRYERFNYHLFQNDNFNVSTFIGEENNFQIQNS